MKKTFYHRPLTHEHHTFVDSQIISFSGNYSVMCHDFLGGGNSTS